LEAEIDGALIRFLLDTGASGLILTPRDAKRIGLNPDGLAYTQPYETANGQVFGAPVRIKTLRLGDRLFHNIPASINGSEMGQSLMGMRFLERFTGGYEVRGKTLTVYP
ncbi:MAG: retroviral-like aspartic protease family protein, partial [Leptospiraceae bacterium]|nr:retroviral-like aspartic protease family protein [Leptospiraceae bacterium]